MSKDRVRLIEQRIRQAVDASHVEIVDVSADHAGHLAAQGGGGHFQLVVVSARFDGLSRVAAQRLIYSALADLMSGDIHAVQMRTFSPEQWRSVRS